VCVIHSLADDTCLSEVVHNTKFKWHPTIIGILQQAPNKQLPVKKLRKKVSLSALVYQLNCISTLCPQK